MFHSKNSVSLYDKLELVLITSSFLNSELEVIIYEPVTETTTPKVVQTRII